MHVPQNWWQFVDYIITSDANGKNQIDYTTFPMWQLKGAKRKLVEDHGGKVLATTPLSHPSNGIVVLFEDDEAAIKFKLTQL